MSSRVSARVPSRSKTKRSYRSVNNMDSVRARADQGARVRRVRDLRAARFPAAARKIQARRNPKPKVMGMVMIWTNMGKVYGSFMRKQALLGTFTTEGEGLSYGKGRGESPV